jgi:hypothetical protein
MAEPSLGINSNLAMVVVMMMVVTGSGACRNNSTSQNNERNSSKKQGAQLHSGTPSQSASLPNGLSVHAAYRLIDRPHHLFRQNLTDVPTLIPHRTSKSLDIYQDIFPLNAQRKHIHPFMRRILR